VEKIERDGKVAVLYSPGFGAGWYTWNSKEIGARGIFLPRLVLAVLGESGEHAEQVAGEEFPRAYTGGVKSLAVQWVPKGSRFEIDEYDGSESVRVIGPDDGFVA
jgi:hypothetical protein